MRIAFPTSRFHKDLRMMTARGYDARDAYKIIEILKTEPSTPKHLRPHKLKGKWAGHWECHIAFDWLLVYVIDNTKLILVRTGTHGDIFG